MNYGRNASTISALRTDTITLYLHFILFCWTTEIKQKFCKEYLRLSEMLWFIQEQHHRNHLGISAFSQSNSECQVPWDSRARFAQSSNLKRRSATPTLTTQQSHVCRFFAKNYTPDLDMTISEYFDGTNFKLAARVWNLTSCITF